jgi:hypothetical protein
MLASYPFTHFFAKEAPLPLLSLILRKRHWRLLGSDERKVAIANPSIATPRREAGEQVLAVLASRG